MEPGNDDRDLIHPKESSPPKTNADVAPLIQKVGAPSIAQIEKLIRELHKARNLLEAERERIQREISRYLADSCFLLVHHEVQLPHEARSTRKDAGVDRPRPCVA